MGCGDHRGRGEEIGLALGREGGRGGARRLVRNKHGHDGGERGAVLPMDPELPVLGLRGQRQRHSGADRHFEDDAGELRLRREGPRAVGEPEGATDEGGGKISPRQGRSVHPGREARIPLEPPAPSVDVTQHLDLRSARPADGPHGRFDGAEEIGGQLTHVSRPRLAFGRDDALAHVERVAQPAVVGGETDRLLVPAHVDLDGQAIGLPALAHPGTHLLELAPVPHRHRLVVGPLDPHSPGVSAAEGVDLLVGGGEIQRWRDLERQELGHAGARFAAGRERLFVRGEEERMGRQGPREPRHLEIEGGNPQRTLVELRLHFLGVEILFDEVPGRLQPGRVEYLMVKAGAPRPVVDAHQLRRGECRTQGARDAQPRRRAGAGVEARDEDRFFHRLVAPRVGRACRLPSSSVRRCVGGSPAGAQSASVHQGCPWRGPYRKKSANSVPLLETRLWLTRRLSGL